MSLPSWPCSVGKGGKKRTADKKTSLVKVGAYEAVLEVDGNSWHTWSQLHHRLLPPATCWTPLVLVLLSSTLQMCRHGGDKPGIHEGQPSTQNLLKPWQTTQFPNFTLKPFLISELLQLQAQRLAWSESLGSRASTLSKHCHLTEWDAWNFPPTHCFSFLATGS